MEEIEGRQPDAMEAPVSSGRAVMGGQGVVLREMPEGNLIFSAIEKLKLIIYRQQVANAKVSKMFGGEGYFRV